MMSHSSISEALKPYGHSSPFSPLSKKFVLFPISYKKKGKSTSFSSSAQESLASDPF